nr:hypothetical protein PIFADJLK_00059 [Oryctes rhinoceros nudivirus]WDA64886.1 hypothetical protein NNONMNKP_00073 [Oryctes rhinoceros nudivirus]
MARKQSFLENVRYLECLTYDEFALFSYTIDVLSPDLNNDEDLYLLELPKIQRIHQLLFAPNVEHAGQIRTKNVKPSGMLPVYANYMDISAQLASLIKKQIRCWCVRWTMTGMTNRWSPRITKLSSISTYVF